MKNTTKRTMLFCTLVALLTTGCGEPVFSQMKSSKPKWAMAVVAKPGSTDESTTVENLVNQLAYQEETAAVVNWTSPEKAADTIQKLATQKLTGQTGADMILTDEAPANLNALAQQNPQIRFTVLGDSSTPTFANVRHLVLDRQRLLFLAGYLAAVANKQSSQPFSVLVDHPLAADDPDWQMILAGNHYAGRNDVPVQVQNSAAPPAKKSGTGSTASPTAGSTANGNGQGAQSTLPTAPPTPLQLSGKAMVLLTPVTDQTVSQLQSKRMELIQTDETGQPSLLQSNVIAAPAPFLESALQEEATALATDHWQAGQVVTIPLTKMYNLLLPQDFPDKQIGALLDIVEEQLTNGTLKPADYVAGSKPTG